MLVQIHSDNKLTKTDEFSLSMIEMISYKLRRFSNHITRIEVYFTDEDSHKESPNDKRCLLEARFERNRSLAATNYGDTYEKAAFGAIDKLKSVLSSKLERIRSH